MFVKHGRCRWPKNLHIWHPMQCASVEHVDKPFVSRVLIHKKPRLRQYICRPVESEKHVVTVRVDIIGHFKPCMTEIYLHI